MNVSLSSIKPRRRQLAKKTFIRNLNLMLVRPVFNILQETKMKVQEVKFQESINSLYHRNEELMEKLDMVEQERATFLMRVESMNLEIQKYKDDMIAMKDQLHNHIDDTHHELKKSILDYNTQLEKVTGDLELEKKKLHSSNKDIKDFCYTIEVNTRRIDEVELVMK